MTTPTSTQPADPLGAAPNPGLPGAAGARGDPRRADCGRRLRLHMSMSSRRNSLPRAARSGSTVSRCVAAAPPCPRRVLVSRSRSAQPPGKGGHSPARDSSLEEPLPGSIFLAALATLLRWAPCSARTDRPRRRTAVLAWPCTSPSGTCRPGHCRLGRKLRRDRHAVRLAAAAAFLLMEAAGSGRSHARYRPLPGLLAAGIGARSLSGDRGSATSRSRYPTCRRTRTQTWPSSVGARRRARYSFGGRSYTVALVRLHVDLVPPTPVAGAGGRRARDRVRGCHREGRSGGVSRFLQSALPTLVDQASSYSCFGRLPTRLAGWGSPIDRVAEQLPRRPGLSGHVPRRGGRCRHVPPAYTVPAVAMGIGAMSVTMLRLPLTSVLLATLLLGSDGLAADTAGDRGGRRGLRGCRANCRDKTPAAESAPAPSAPGKRATRTPRGEWHRTVTAEASSGFARIF